MTIISESQVRMFHLKLGSKTLTLPSDAVITPAAMDYVREHRMEILREGAASNGVDAKPQHMTHGCAGKLVLKSDPLIRLRGKLDTLTALTAGMQWKFGSAGHHDLVEELEELLLLFQAIIRAEVLSQPLQCDGIWGKSWKWYHQVSHNPQKYFGVKHATVSHLMGGGAVALNYLRTQIREAELAAVEAFCSGGALGREDIILVLNRLSSAVYVKYLQQCSRRGEKEESHGSKLN